MQLISSNANLHRKCDRFRALSFELLERRFCLSSSPVDTAPLTESLFDVAGHAASAAGLIENRAVTTDSSVQQMPSVAVNPHDPLHVVIAYMDYSLLATGYAGIGVAVSRDGGGTWQHSAIAQPKEFDQGAANPVVRFDDQGRLFVSFMAVTYGGDKPGLTNPSGGPGRTLGFTSNSGVFVARSDDGGLAWNSPVAVVSHVYDGQTKVPFEINPDLAVDTFRLLPDGRPNPSYGNLYAVWARFYPPGQFPGDTSSSGGSQALFAVSEDGGDTWQLCLQTRPGKSMQESVIIDRLNTGAAPPGLGAINWPHVSVGPEGDVYVSAFVFESFDVFHSRDAGRHFAAPDYQTGAGLPFGGSFVASPALTLGDNRFRVQVVRSIAADPSRPGHAYVTEAVKTYDAVGNVIDAGDIRFARTTDYGLTWTAEVMVGDRNAQILNGDNGLQATRGTSQDVAAGQVLPRVAVDGHGNLAVLWYDARRDPHNHHLDVFGSASSDGGVHFTPNFRVSDRSFNPGAGRFIDITGAENFYLGDFLGLALDGGWAYSAWSDTRNENQDIYFARFPIAPAPSPLGDRWEPNNKAPAATDLGLVIRQRFPKLEIAAGDEDWIRLTTAADGQLTVLVQPEQHAARLRLELWDDSGTELLATGVRSEEVANVVSQVIRYPVRTGETYLVHVRPGEGATAVEGYALEIESLTANLGTRVQGRQAGVLEPAAKALYLLTSAAAGSLEVTLSSSAGGANVEIIDFENPARVLASGVSSQDRTASARIEKGQSVLLRVSGDPHATTVFLLDFTNLDQFSSSHNQTLSLAAGNGPSQAALADLDGDGDLDIAVTNALSDTLSVALGNGDGTFQAARQFTLGAFDDRVGGEIIGFSTFGRAVIVVDVNGDRRPDVVAANSGSSDVSVLLGRGDGTFESQRRFDATARPFALAHGDFNGDGAVDLVVIDSGSTPAEVAVLLGRGDGTFQPRRTFQLPAEADNPPFTGVATADLDGDGHADLLITDDQQFRTFVYLGDGKGMFRAGATLAGAGRGTAILDLNGDGKLDFVNTIKVDNTVRYALGNGDGTFQKPTVIPVGQSPLDMVVGDFGAPQLGPAGRREVAPPDGIPDLIVVNSGIPQPTSTGPAEVVVLFGKTKEGQFAGFDAPLRLADAKGPQNVKLGDVNGDGATDAVVTDQRGLFVIFGKRPEFPAADSLATARDLGTVVHLAQPTLTITPGHDEIYYRLQVPVEVLPGAGDQVLDFSAGFAYLEGVGLSMAVLDAGGNLVAEGDRLRVRAGQGETLFVRIRGQADAQGVRGAGAYTLVIDTLPQIVDVEAQALLPGEGDRPGGPTTSLVMVLQGDRLDPITAEDPGNYRITWLGPDGQAGTGDERVFQVEGQGETSRRAIYNSGGNIDIATGLTYPTAVRQTVTLLFDEPLPAGSYLIEVAAEVGAVPLNEDEQQLLTQTSGLSGHPIVSLVGGEVREGSSLVVQDLVLPGGLASDFRAFETGTRFLTQFHDDLGALLDAILTDEGENPAITERLLSQVVAAFGPALGPAGERLASMLVILLDPVPISLVDGQQRTVAYDLHANTVVNQLPRTNVNVAGNVEVVTIAHPRGVYELTIPFAPPLARGGVVYFGSLRNEVRSLTEELRNGVQYFRLEFGQEPPAGSPATFIVSAAFVLPAANTVPVAALAAPVSARAAPTAVSPLIPSSNPNALPSSARSDFYAQPNVGSNNDFAAGNAARLWNGLRAAWRRYAGRWEELAQILVPSQAVDALLQLDVRFFSGGTASWQTLMKSIAAVLRLGHQGPSTRPSPDMPPQRPEVRGDIGSGGPAASERDSRSAQHMWPREAAERTLGQGDVPPRSDEKASDRERPVEAKQAGESLTRTESQAGLEEATQDWSTSANGSSDSSLAQSHNNVHPR